MSASEPVRHNTPVYLHPNEDLHLGKHFRDNGYQVIVIGPIPIPKEGSTLGAPQVTKDDT